MSEQSDVTSPLLAALAQLPGVWAMRIHSGSARGGRQHLAPVGTPDVLVIVRGKALFFECKDGYGKVSEVQLETMRRIRLAGAERHVLTSKNEALRIVELFLNGKDGA